MSRTIQLLTSATLAALLGIAALPASAGDATATDSAACMDDTAKAEAQMKREAALADLGRRLAAEPQDDPEARALNRTGHNYGTSREAIEPSPDETDKPH